MHVLNVLPTQRNDYSSDDPKHDLMVTYPLLHLLLLLLLQLLLLLLLLFLLLLLLQLL